MGREIRRVPANWEHPKTERHGRVDYQPLYDRSFDAEMEDWYKQWQEWKAGTHKDFAEYGQKYQFHQRHGNPPNPEYFRPDWKEGEATWYQVYETVSEGTPVTPPFATQAELVDYLVENGDFWDQRRRAEGRDSMPCGPWSRKQAEKFVYGTGWAPSLVIAGGKVMSGVEAL